MPGNETRDARDESDVDTEDAEIIAHGQARGQFAAATGPRMETIVVADTGEVREVVWVPRGDDFDREGSDFLEAPTLEAMARGLMERYEGIRWLEGWRVRFLWKRRGGTRGGNSVLGKCLLPPPIARHFAKADWFIYISADHCRQRLTQFQMDALLFHEMLHCVLKGEDSRPALVGHDFEAFIAEVREFGAWKADLQAAQRVFGHQAPLPEVK